MILDNRFGYVLFDRLFILGLSGMPLARNPGAARKGLSKPQGRTTGRCGPAVVGLWSVQCLWRWRRVAFDLRLVRRFCEVVCGVSAFPKTARGVGDWRLGGAVNEQVVRVRRHVERRSALYAQ